jgi:hypothetical protein
MFRLFTPQRLGHLDGAFPFARRRAFDPETLRIMGSAFEAAWSELIASGSVLAAPFRAEHTRKTLALRIIARAQLGEREVASLRDHALADIKRLVFNPPQPRRSTASISRPAGE